MEHAPLTHTLQLELSYTHLQKLVNAVVIHCLGVVHHSPFWFTSTDWLKYQREVFSKNSCTVDFHSTPGYDIL